jgi:hypothetical protein
MRVEVLHRDVHDVRLAPGLLGLGVGHQGEHGLLVGAALQTVALPDVIAARVEAEHVAEDLEWLAAHEVDGLPVVLRQDEAAVRRHAHRILVEEEDVERGRSGRAGARDALDRGTQAMLGRGLGAETAEDAAPRTQVVPLHHPREPQALHGGWVAASGGLGNGALVLVRHRERVEIGFRRLVQERLRTEARRWRARHLRERPRLDEGDLRLRRRFRGEARELREDAAFLLLQQQRRARLVARLTRRDPGERREGHEQRDRGDQELLPREDSQDLPDPELVRPGKRLAVAAAHCFDAARLGQRGRRGAPGTRSAPPGRGVEGCTSGCGSSGVSPKFAADVEPRSRAS